MKNKITGDLGYVIDEPQFAVSEFHGFDTIYFGEKNKIEIESESSYNNIFNIEDAMISIVWDRRFFRRRENL